MPTKSVWPGRAGAHRAPVHDMHAHRLAAAAAATAHRLLLLPRGDWNVGIHPLRAAQDDARATRQNNNGNRRGLECPEERDYYPYWTPTPWKDIAVLVDDERRCEYYQTNSNNVKAYGECTPKAGAAPQGLLPLAKDACEKAGHVWAEKSWSLPPPECKKTEWSRDNHLGTLWSATKSDFGDHTSPWPVAGNGIGGWDTSYNWTVPDVEFKKCVIRLRYNISTGDYPGQVADEAVTPFFFSAMQNARKKQNDQFPSPIVNESAPLGDSVRQDVIYSFNSGKGLLQMAANTNQFGRTFQDRSYVFHIKKRPAAIPTTAKIYNLGVTGKRGNIVQTFPAHEYDFAPSKLSTAVGDYVHFQWEVRAFNLTLTNVFLQSAFKLTL